jgi:endonuclease/exonuclease/phosphatase family metal-dependent hydrolase
MEKCFGKALVIGFFVVCAAMQTLAQYGDTVKIMTYNINAESHTDGDYADIGDVIKAINPTICGLQKVDSCTVTAAPVYVLKSLGEQTGMTYTFSMSYTKNGGAYGNGFLSDSAPKSSRHLAIPKGSASEDRSALEICITMAGETVRVIVTHLDYGNATNRTAQLQQILTWIDNGGSAADPTVIMADFNANSTESSMKVLTDAGFVYVKGSKGEILDTAQKINHILYRPESRWNIVDVGNPAYSASNRYPLWALMKLLPSNTIASPRERMKNAMGSRITVTVQLLELQLSQPSEVSLGIFALSGKKIAMFGNQGTLAAGLHSFLMPQIGSMYTKTVIAGKINGSKVIKQFLLNQ